MKNNIHEKLDDVNKSLKRLTKQEKHYLEYFWNKQHKSTREIVRFSDVSFVECGTKTKSMMKNHSIEEDIRSGFRGLKFKGYIEVKDGLGAMYYKLTTDGVEYLTHKHPSWKIRLEQLADSTPFFVKILVGFIGLIASIFGIIQFMKE